jgi:glycosyltransferase involved in cell wall biosynthesis
MHAFSKGMAMNPAISVIIRTLGRSHLEDALGSLVPQTERNFEAIVVDMSRGGNAKTLAKFEPHLPLRVITASPLSRPAALNLGIDAARSPVISILDDDNLYDAHQLELFRTGLARTGAGYVYAGVRHVTYSTAGEFVAEKDTARDFSFAELLRGNYIYATGSAFRKEFWEEAGRYDERFDVLEDWEFLIRAAQRGTIRFLETTAGTSRKFTGIDGVSAFNLEGDRVRRCVAGVYWKHRRVQLTERWRDRASSGRRVAPRAASGGRSGLVARAIRIARLSLDLCDWFLHNLRDVVRSH